MAHTITANVSRRIPLGGTEAMYLGTLTPDKEYLAGGDAIVATEGAALNLPSTIHHMSIFGGGGGVGAEWVPSTGKVKLILGAESGSGLKGGKEMAEGVDASALSLPFVAYGP